MESNCRRTRASCCTCRSLSVRLSAAWLSSSTTDDVLARRPDSLDSLAADVSPPSEDLMSSGPVDRK